MTNPAIDYAQPDVEAHLHTLLSGFTGTTLWVSEVDFRYPFWACAYRVEVICTAGSKRAASDLANDVGDRILATRVLPWDAGVVLVSEALDAPAWSPRENGAPAYACAYRLVVRPKGTTP